MSLSALTEAAHLWQQRLPPPKEVKEAASDLMELYNVVCRVEVPVRKARVRKAFQDASSGLINRFLLTTMEDLHFLAKHSDHVGLYYLKLSIIYITMLSGVIDPKKSYYWLSKFIGTVDQTFTSQPSLYESVLFVKKCFTSVGGEDAKCAINLINMYLKAPCFSYKVASEF